jgi:UDP-N-acetylmuramate dehydrogenase
MNGHPLPPPESTTVSQLICALQKIPALLVRRDAPLKEYTRFAVGGPAAILVETAVLDSLVQAVAICRSSGLPHCLIGEGSNLIASDSGFAGTVLRWTARSLNIEGLQVEVDAGAALLELVGATVEAGLQGLETLAGIPGSVGAAIYGNAGAYGHSISESISEVRFLDGETVRCLDQAGCRFQYRESLFKQHKDWFVLAAVLQLEPGNAANLRRIADDTIADRNRKFAPELRCAGSVFKNLLAADLPTAVLAQIPPHVLRESKVPAGWFLEQVGAKGMVQGDIHVAEHHANLLYNAGSGTASQIRDLIARLKRLVFDRYGIILEEEVQYLGHF